MIEGAGIPRQGNPVLAGGEEVGVVTSGTFSPSLEVGVGMAYVRADLAEPGTEVEIDVRGKRRPARIASKPLYTKGELSLGRRELPRRACATTTEHDWARLEGDEATLRDHLVRPGRARRGRLLRPARGRRDDRARTPSYAEVESVKAVSDVIAPLSGEIVEVNDALDDAPEQINEDPYGEGWLVKVKLTAPAEAEAPARRRRIPQAAGERLGAARPPLP